MHTPYLKNTHTLMNQLFGLRICSICLIGLVVSWCVTVWPCHFFEGCSSQIRAEQLQSLQGRRTQWSTQPMISQQQLHMSRSLEREDEPHRWEIDHYSFQKCDYVCGWNNAGRRFNSLQDSKVNL